MRIVIQIHDKIHFQTWNLKIRYPCFQKNDQILLTKKFSPNSWAVCTKSIEKIMDEVQFFLKKLSWLFVSEINFLRKSNKENTKREYYCISAENKTQNTLTWEHVFH